jgi:hypothetical protein
MRNFWGELRRTLLGRARLQNDRKYLARPRAYRAYRFVVPIDCRAVVIFPHASNRLGSAIWSCDMASLVDQSLCQRRRNVPEPRPAKLPSSVPFELDIERYLLLLNTALQFFSTELVG